MSGFKAKMHRWGSAQTPLGELTALPRPVAVHNGPTSKGRGGKGGEERGREVKVKESEGETKWREGFGPPKNFGVAPL